MVLLFPMGFAFALVNVATTAIINERVPVWMQGRVFALMMLMTGIAALPPLLAGGGADGSGGCARGVGPVPAAVGGRLGLDPLGRYPRGWGGAGFGLAGRVCGALAAWWLRRAGMNEGPRAGGPGDAPGLAWR